jgi:hypothetical protein
MSKATYKAKTLRGAELEVSRRRRDIVRLNEVIARLATKIGDLEHDRQMLARLAAKGPAFSNPIHAAHAEALRDRILAELGMNPYGKALPK